jgi:hypothetical protein
MIRFTFILVGAVACSSMATAQNKNDKPAPKPEQSRASGPNPSQGNPSPNGPGIAKAMENNSDRAKERSPVFVSRPAVQ